MSRKRTIAESSSKDDSVVTEVVDAPKEVGNSHITREVLQRVPIGADGKYLKIMSWNVNGLRALVTSKISVLLSLIKNHDPDILCLQETKIQDNTISDYDNLLDGYESYWNCSTVKKGYSGTAVFLKKSTIGIATGISRSGSATTITAAAESSVKAAPRKQAKLSAMWKTAKPATTEAEEETLPTSTGTSSQTEEKAKSSQLASMLKVSYDFEDDRKCFAGEGRTITVELDSFFLVACYVPNSGEGLVRLKYRVDEWEPHMRQYLKQLSALKPVVYTGDLNCGHLDLDIHNPTAKHIAKQAGLTAEERAAFAAMLSETGFRDAFRHFHPDAKGQFTYWSVRAFNRPGNKGIRLDYFICSPDLFPDVDSSSKESRLKVHDTYILPADTVGCSDHCPVTLVLEC